MSPRHPDGVGYLDELVTAVAKPWFTMIRDLAISNQTARIERGDLDALTAVFANKASYRGRTQTNARIPPVYASSSGSFLELLHGFSNFKLLKGTPALTLRKRVTIVFGTNGSGKSSLCEALRVLASAEPPVRPLHNLRATATSAPGFIYKFRGDLTVRTGTMPTGFGAERSSVKYFDSGTAQKYVLNAAEPGRVVPLIPFCLHVFDWSKAFATALRGGLQKMKDENAACLKRALERLRAEFQRFGSMPLASINNDPAQVLAQEITVGEAFAHQDQIQEKRAVVIEMEKATSEDGLRLLRAECREIESVLRSMDTFLDSVESLWEICAAEKAKTLEAKRAALGLLASAFVPDFRIV